MTLPRIPRTSLLLLLLGILGGHPRGFAASPDAASQTLRPYRAEYQLTWHGIEVGRLDIALTLRSDGSYRYTGDSTPLGLLAEFRNDSVHEQSEGRIEKGRVIPLHYEYHHRNPDRPRDVSIQFDWEHGEARNRINGAEWRMALSPGSQDKFSQQLELMSVLNRSPSAEPRFPVADGGKLKEYRFQSSGRERLEAILGGVETLKLVRRKGDQPSNMTLWLAPAYHHIPVRFERDEEEDRLLAELVSLRWGE